MGHIFCLMGKSACGKDTIYNMLINDNELNLKRIVPYTTRPMRSGETQGSEYNFTDMNGLMSLREQGLVIEERCYNTVHGDWYYFTVDDGTVTKENDYIVIGTLPVFIKLSAFYGNERVVPIYIEIDDGERLERALSRERQQAQPKYKELCRRFLADAEDFSEENLKNAGVVKRYSNEVLENCIQEIRESILNYGYKG